MVNWRTVIIGFILAVVLSEFLGFIGLTIGAAFGSNVSNTGQIIGYLLATIYVGYSIDGNYINGAIYGAIIGFIGGLVSLIVTGAIFGTFVVTTGSLTVLALESILYGITGAIGGIIGFIISVYFSRKEEPAV